MSRFVAEPYLAELKSFQRDTVEHVTNRFHGPDPCTRFLVADETGLGKSMVARGVIARTIERLQDDPGADRIDIVYICSNADIAAQNLGRLNITGNSDLAFGGRLSLLALHSKEFSQRRHTLIDKPINLVSFSPGTSFEFGSQLGRVEERALLFVLLADRLGLDGHQQRAARLMLRGPAKADSLDRSINGLGVAGIDEALWTAFLLAVKEKGLDTELLTLLAAIGRRRYVPKAERSRRSRLVGELRRELARVNVSAITPDLVILDEFQRFHHLLDGAHNEASELAHQLFGVSGARVLLLSATPYKPFTFAEEAVDNHRTSFFRTLRFLAEGCPSLSAVDVAADLDRYREAATSGQPVSDVADRIRSRLTRVMTRQERPRHIDDQMLTERVTECGATEDDLVAYVRLRGLARLVGGELAMDYWKSVPYFANFMDTYQLGAKVRDALASPKLRRRTADALQLTNRLDPDALLRFGEVDLGNARLRGLAAQTTGAGWWRLLWLPPSLPYLRPDGPFAEEFAATITKRLIFSAWAAAPTAVAALLSYDAERRTAADSPTLTENTAANRARIGRPLEYRGDSGPAALTTLAMFWPSPDLARRADPREQARWVPDGLLDGGSVEHTVATNSIEPRRRELAQEQGIDRDDAWFWAFAWPEAMPVGLDPEVIAQLLRGGDIGGDLGEPDDEAADAGGLGHLVTDALAIAGGGGVPYRRTAETGVTLTRIALHSPGNIAWRALRRLAGPAVTDAGLWRAATVLAAGLRTLFNRPETTVLLATLMPGEDHRSSVLRYCAWGNLQAVLDEYLHHLALAEGIRVADDVALAELAGRARVAITLRPARYQATDPVAGRPIPFTSRFALRYGGRHADEDSARQPEIRAAFNSPFWPFVLASTSVGQEGIDLHWWCHAVLHWNVPTNPVDFEQREGRIHRYAGHAVRRNIAHRHRGEIIRSAAADPWAAAYDIAGLSVADLGQFAPHWVFPGPAKIERHLAPYPLSQDLDRLERVKTSRMLYRLTFGQPRQEDMLELLRAQGLHNRPTVADEMRIDLSPPPRAPLS